MKRLLLVPILLCLIGCSSRVDDRIIRSVELIQSASVDIQTHCAIHCKEFQGAAIAAYTEEKAKEDSDTDKLRVLSRRIADEQEMLDALKELPLALKDLEEYLKNCNK